MFTTRKQFYLDPSPLSGIYRAPGNASRQLWRSDCDRNRGNLSRLLRMETRPSERTGLDMIDTKFFTQHGI
jgi:hypothetical protein